MAIVKHITPASAFRVGLVMYGCLGLILGVICTLATAIGAPFLRGVHLPFGGAFIGYFAIIICPIVYGIIGSIGATIAALIYNFAAGFIGGLEVDIS